MSRVIAIDFGTTNTVVAEWCTGDDAPRTLRLPRLSTRPEGEVPAVVPSLLYVRNAARGEVLVGEEVRRGGWDRVGDGRFFAGFKRHLAADIPGFIPELDGVEATPEWVATQFLRAVLWGLEDLDVERDEFLFTVPVGAFQRYVGWLQTFAQAQGLRRLRIMDESTAAALGYEVAQPHHLLLVFDFGGGSLDLSLVRTPSLHPQAWKDSGSQVVCAAVLAKAGQMIGGEDLDEWLLDDLLARLNRSREEVRGVLRPLRAAAEAVKKRLSFNSQAEFRFFDADAQRMYRLTYRREEFEALLAARGLFDRLHSTFDLLFQQAAQKGIGREDVEHVLLVGGSSKIPAVQELVRKEFGEERVRTHRPFEAVAHGAARFGHDLRLRDFVYHSYGVRGWNHAARQHEYDLIVPALTPYPTLRPIVREYAASVPDQPAMELVVGEIEHGEAQRLEVVVRDHRARVLRSPATPTGYRLVSADRVVPVNEGLLVPLDPPGQPGVNRLRVAFAIDGQRTLRVTVTDLLTGQVLLQEEPLAQLR